MSSKIIDALPLPAAPRPAEPAPRGVDGADGFGPVFQQALRTDDAFGGDAALDEADKPIADSSEFGAVSDADQQDAEGKVADGRAATSGDESAAGDDDAEDSDDAAALAAEALAASTQVLLTGDADARAADAAEEIAVVSAADGLVSQEEGSDSAQGAAKGAQQEFGGGWESATELVDADAAAASTTAAEDTLATSGTATKSVERRASTDGSTAGEVDRTNGDGTATDQVDADASAAPHDDGEDRAAKSTPETGAAEGRGGRRHAEAVDAAASSGAGDGAATPQVSAGESGVDAAKRSTDDGAAAAPISARAPESSAASRGVSALTRLSSERSMHAAAAAGDDGANIDPARFVGRVEGALRAAQQRDGRVQVRLSPPELGALRIELTIQQGVMSARLEAETATARNMLLDNLPALRERLAQQDVRVDRFDVDLRQETGGGGSGQTGAQDRQARESHWRPGPSRQERATGTPAPVSSNSAAGGRRSDAALDVRV